jgi:hypothetical protein
MTSPAEVDYHDVNPEKNETVIAITIYEGRNRQVRRMFEAIHFPVIRLKRIQFGPLHLIGLPRGKFRHLTPEEVKALSKAALEVSKPPQGQGHGDPETGHAEIPEAAAKPRTATAVKPKRAAAKSRTEVKPRTATKPNRQQNRKQKQNRKGD